MDTEQLHPCSIGRGISYLAGKANRRTILTESCCPCERGSCSECHRFFLVAFRLRPVLIRASCVLTSTPHPTHSLVYDVCANEEDHYGRSTSSRKEGSENKKAQSGRQEGSADSAVKGGWQKSSLGQKATSGCPESGGNSEAQTGCICTNG